MLFWHRMLLCALLVCAFSAAYPVLAQSPGPASPCEPWAARLISYQGTLLARRASGIRQASLGLNETFCVGDVLEIGPYSRAALQLPDQTVVRLDQGTVVTFAAPKDEKRSWLDIIKGAIHIISRDPRALRVITPFANAGIEGTEFFLQVGPNTTFVLVYEGRVKVENALGAATAGSGESVLAQAGSAPVLQQVVRPRDRVVWTLYYPPTGSGPLPAADAMAAGAPSVEFLVGRAEQRLAVGRVSEAEEDLNAALRLAPGSAEVLARQSVIALTRNDAATARELGDRAVATAPSSSSARLAQSYARQSAGDLPGAVETLEAAAASNPGDALVRARLAELYLASGDVDRSETSAKAAVSADPKLGLAQTILGFAWLTRVQLAAAIATFEEAIRLDPGAPLPRLGIGLARIRGGDLEAGREEIETAVILDPNNSLVRSYMGKAYYEEKRDGLAASQLEIAKELDPNDPTPWFYDAIRKQSVNDPVGALGDLQESVERNDNRAVYRSRLELDQDLAARSASRGRIYRDLGFGELALREGWESVNTDPRDYSGHRLLSDSYALLPRHERARVSELYQSQLRQPINLTPVQPQLGEANLFILDSAGPSTVAFNEFNPLFTRNGTMFQLSGVAGGNDSWGNDAVVAGVNGRMSFSLGQFHFETDGFRENNDFEQDTLNAILQFAATPNTSLFAEARSTNAEQGDLQLLFDPTNYIPNLRQSEESDAIRLGLRHDFNARSQLLASAIYQTADLGAMIEPVFSIQSDVAGYSLELQHHYRGDSWWLTSGLRLFQQDVDEQQDFAIPIPDPPFILESSELVGYRPDLLGAYVYAAADLLTNLQLTAGASIDRLRGQLVDKDRISPKLGLTWMPTSSTTIRLATFRTLQEPQISRQNQEPRLEPTQVAGFNQFFFGSEGQRATRTGLGIDQRIAPELLIGAEGSRRDVKIPQFIAGFPDPVDEVDVDERLARAYAYWAPLPYLALRAEYQYEKIDNNGVVFADQYSKLTTKRLPIGVSAFSSRGLSGGIRWTFVNQKGMFNELVPPFGTVRGSDSFSVVDAEISYRLPDRRGIISIKGSNLFDESFRFQDTDAENPQILPERFVVGRFTVAF